MGKNNKNNNKPKVVPSAPETAKKEEKVEVINEQRKIEVIDANGLRDALTNPNRSTLDANHQVDLLNGLDRHFMQPNAAEKLGLSEETVKSINIVTAHGWVVAMANELAYGKSEFAAKLKSIDLPKIIEAGKSMNILFDTKLLPAPDTEGNVTIPATAVKVSKEAKESLEKEQKAVAKKPEVDPTKITSEAELKDALLFILADRANTFDKLVDSVAFYRSYLTIQAKTEDEKKKVENKKDLELLTEIKNLVHDCPLVLSGIGRSMSTFVGSSKSPVSAFCMLRNAAKNRKTGEYRFPDQEIADYTRILVSWANDLNIEKYEKNLKDHEKNLKELSKDKKNNAKGIEDVKERIENCKNSIAHLKEITENLFDPSSESVDTLLEKYAEKDRMAITTFNHVVNGYYENIDREKVNMEDLKHNVQQRAGMILNLFRDPTQPILEYCEANLTEMPVKEEEEEKK